MNVVCASGITAYYGFRVYFYKEIAEIHETYHIFIVF